MKWEETTTSKCRYGDIAGTIWEDWDILWEDSYNDWQGSAEFIAEKDGKYCFYEWSYGSCSGCDDWEARGVSDEDIAKEMKNSAMWFSGEQALRVWYGMLEEENKEYGENRPAKVFGLRKILKI